MFNILFKAMLSDRALVNIAHQEDNNLTTTYKSKGNWDLWVDGKYVRTVWFS